MAHISSIRARCWGFMGGDPSKPGRSGATLLSLMGMHRMQGGYAQALQLVVIARFHSSRDQQTGKAMTKPKTRRAGSRTVAAKPASLRRPIVSSAHLASEKLTALSEFEFALMMSGNAFARWIVRCMTAAGQPDLAALDVM